MSTKKETKKELKKETKVDLTENIKVKSPVASIKKEKEKDVELIYDQWSDTRHIREKDMYLGTKDVIEKPEYITDSSSGAGTIVKKNVNLSIAFRTCIDEILVNAIDHKTRNPDSVYQIRVTYDKESGEISILNDGPGIPIEIHPKHNIYIPEMVATNTKSGSNLEKNISNETTGGTNGYGMTLTIICSEYSSIQTLTDPTNKLTDESKFYHQNYRIVMNGKEPELIKDQPTIVSGIKDIKNMLTKTLTKFNSLASKNYILQPHTKVTFKIDYKLMGYNKVTDIDKDVIYKIIEQRLIQTSVFINSNKPSKQKQCNIYLNDNLITVTSLQQYANMFTVLNSSYRADNTSSELIDSSDPELSEKPQNSVVTICKSENSEYTWEVCVIPFNDGTGMNQISIVNGIYPYNGGTHIDFLKKQISDKLSEKLKKEFKDMDKIRASNITDNIFIFMKGYIANPKWGEQRKSELQTKKTAYTGYELPTKFLNSVWEMMRDHLKNEFIHNIAESTPTPKKTKIDKKKKYDPAEYAGTAQSLLCRLWIPEGDSAETCIVTGLTNPKCNLGKDYNGIFNIGGVTVNARKETTKFEKINKDKSISYVYTKTEKLKNTERLNSLVDVLGLDYNKTYDLTPLGDNEYKTLRYGCIILAVDQDLDGLGFIASNIMSFIHLFWPKLYNRGFVKRFATPLMRAFPNNVDIPVISFYSEQEYNKWKTQFPNEEPPTSGSKGYEIRYYKGLAGHEKDSIPQMFSAKSLENNLITYYLDNESDKLFDDYFGKDSDVRKDILSVPVDYKKYENLEMPNINNIDIFNILTDIKNKTKIVGGMMNIIYFDNTKPITSHKMLNNNSMPQASNLMNSQNSQNSQNSMPQASNSIISVSRHLQVETKEFQLDNVDRKISHAIDGLNPSKRKAFAGARKKLNNDNQSLKVFQLSGYIAEQMSYHHGDASLNQTVIGMTQNFIGKKTMPLLLGVSNGFGSRLKGDDVGSPRYISLKLNRMLTNALFPVADDYILNYKFVDGSRAEPDYYVPIIPYSILEHASLPGTGWKCEIWGRDVFSVINLVRDLINGKVKLSDVPNKIQLPFNKYKFTGTIVSSNTGTKTVRGNKFNNVVRNFSVGVYSIDEKANTVTISELPHGVWISPYKDKMLDKEFITNIRDLSDPGDGTVNIIFKLKPNSMDSIRSYAKDIWDGFQVYFELYESLCDNINLITPDGCVKEYNNYESVLVDWYLERKEYYKLRLEREIQLTKLRILFIENIIRFCENYKKYNLEVSEEIVNQFLKKEKYNTFNESKLNSPQYLETNNFTQVIIDSGSYDYLHNLTTREKIYEEPKKARLLKLTNLKKYLSELEDSYNFKKPFTFPGASIWLNELNELEKVVEVGINKNWLICNGEKMRKYN